MTKYEVTANANFGRRRVVATDLTKTNAEQVVKDIQKRGRRRDTALNPRIRKMK